MPQGISLDWPKFAGEVLKLWNEGFSRDKIAIQLGVAKSTVNKGIRFAESIGVNIEEQPGYRLERSWPTPGCEANRDDYVYDIRTIFEKEEELKRINDEFVKALHYEKARSDRIKLLQKRNKPT